MTDQAHLAIEHESLKSGLYNRVVEGNVEYTACRGCLYPEGSWPGMNKHGTDCWVEKLLASAPNDLGAELLETGHEMAHRLTWLTARAHDEAEHTGQMDACTHAGCALDRELLGAWRRLTGQQFRAGRAWPGRVTRMVAGDGS